MGNYDLSVLSLAMETSMKTNLYIHTLKNSLTAYPTLKGKMISYVFLPADIINFGLFMFSSMWLIFYLFRKIDISCRKNTHINIIVQSLHRAGNLIPVLLKYVQSIAPVSVVESAINLIHTTALLSGKYLP